MPEPFRVVEEWPPNTVRIMRPEKVARRRGLPSTRVMIVVLSLAIGLGAGVYVSGAGAAVVGVRPFELCCGFGFTGETITYGEPDIHVFRPTDKVQPFIKHEIRSTSRWTVTVVSVEDPVPSVSWEHRMSREDAVGPGAGVRFRPFTLAPGEFMNLYFVGELDRCQGTPDKSYMSTTVSDGLRVTYRIAGITRTTVLAGHRYVVEKPGSC